MPRARSWEVSDMFWERVAPLIPPRAVARTWASVPAQAWGRTQGDGPAAGLRGHRLRPAHWVSVESVAQRAIWQCQFGAPLFPDVAEPRVLPGAMAGWTRRVRRHGGHRLAMAKRGRNDAESPARPGVRRTQPDGPGEKMEASGTSWSTGVGSRCRSASPGPTGMMSRSSRPSSTPCFANRAPSSHAPARRPRLLRPAGARCRHHAELPRSHPPAGQGPARPTTHAPALGRRGGTQLVQPLPQAPRSLREAPRQLPRPRPSRGRHHLLEESSAYLWISPKSLVVSVRFLGASPTRRGILGLRPAPSAARAASATSAPAVPPSCVIACSGHSWAGGATPRPSERAIETCSFPGRHPRRHDRHLALRSQADNCLPSARHWH